MTTNNEYETEEPGEYDDSVEDQIEDDEIEPQEEAFVKGYEKDQEDSFEGKEKNKKIDETNSQ